MKRIDTKALLATDRSPAERKTDAGSALAAAAVGGLLLAVMWPAHQPLLGAIEVAGGLLACGSLLVRRSRPLAVAVFTTAVAGVSPMAIVAALSAIANAAQWCRPRTYALFGAYVVLVAAAHVGLHLDHAVFLSHQPNAVLGLVIGLGLGLLGRAQRLKADSDQRQRIEQARTAERRQIAREMHDVLAHRISMVSVHAGALEFHPDAPSEDIASAAGVIRASAHAALTELRQVISLLRDPTDASANGDTAAAPRPQPMLQDLPQLIEDSRQAGMRVDFDRRLTQPGTVPDAIGRTVYRIVQEGLTNARKHAPTSDVEVQISDQTGDLIVSVLTRPPADEPAGAQTPGPSKLAAAALVPGTGTGLIGLNERVMLAHGQLQHGPSADGGYALTATLPVPG